MNVYISPVDKLLTYGSPEPVDMDQWPDYLALGLTTEHIPELLRMVGDQALLTTTSEVSISCWAPLHALRALGQLRDVSALEPLLELSDLLLDDEKGLGEWAIEELPEVYASFGSQAIPALATALAMSSKDAYARSCAASGLAKIGLHNPEHRLACIEALSNVLAEPQENGAELNGFIVSALVDLKAVEAAAVIEEAIKDERVDIMITGDWDEVQADLGLKLPSPVEGSVPMATSLPPLSGAGRYAVRPRRRGSNAMSRKDKAKMSKITRKKNKRRRKGV